MLLEFLLRLGIKKSIRVIKNTKIKVMSDSIKKYYELVDPQQYSGDLAYFPVNIGVVADMDASDTAYIRYVQSSGSAQTDINTDARFMGYLLG